MSDSDSCGGAVLIGLLHSLFRFYQKRPISAPTLGVVASAFLFHTLFLLWIGSRRHPIPTCRSHSFFAWCITLTFMLASRTDQRPRGLHSTPDIG